MVKKALKVIVIGIMVLGIAFSISNFILMELNAKGTYGAWVFSGGKIRCMGDGNECSIDVDLP